MIGVIAPYLSKFHRSYQSNDIIDRLNYQYTSIIIALTAFTLAATQYVGKPIQVSFNAIHLLHARLIFDKYLTKNTFRQLRENIYKPNR